MVVGHSTYHLFWPHHLLHVGCSRCLLTDLILEFSAKLLAHEILDDPRLRSYADIGRKAFGPKSSLLTNILFCLELFSLRYICIYLFRHRFDSSDFFSVVLVTLTADSLEGVWPAYSADTYKIFSLFM